MEHVVAFWNVENLFDVEHSSRRSEKLSRTLGREIKGWDQDTLNRKINQLALVIGRINNGAGPDILGVCEVENEFVIQLLVEALAPLNRAYMVVHADTGDRRGIDVAFIYDGDRFAAEESFSHFVVKRTATRDLFQVNFRSSAGNRLVLIGNHWPARMGGELASEPFRIIAAETLAYFHERIREIYGLDTAIMALGDFNDEPFNRSLAEHALAEHVSAVVLNARNPVFYNLMWPFLHEGIGTHYHQNRPNLLDQFLISKSILKGTAPFTYKNDSVQIMRVPEMVSPGDYPAPVRFGRGDKINRDGFSDHFPIVMSLQEA